ncbi:MAG: carboxypeptidase regulatory-like domain-containing protein [Bacteroidota bacterium]
MKFENIRPVFFILVIFLAGSCAREVYDLSWEGVVAEKNTGKPVPNARISASSVYQKNIDETAEFEDQDVSDNEGRFQLSFPRGFGLTVRTNASGYLSGVDYKVVKNSEISDTIFISRHPFNASLVVRMREDESFSPVVPYLRETRILSDEGGSRKNVVMWGFDFLNGKNTSNLDSADIWVEINRKNRQAVLHASDKGGIFPVYSSDDFLTNITKAPESGYVKQHVRSGDETGFFVLCRNGIHVAKIVPEDRLCVLSYPKKDGDIVEEAGIRFDYLFQPDLENRLYFPVSASAEMQTIQNAGLDKKVFKVELPE